MNFFISIFSQTISKVLIKTVLIGSVGVFGVGIVTDSVMATLNATAFNTVAQPISTGNFEHYSISRLWEHRFWLNLFQA